LKDALFNESNFASASGALNLLNSLTDFSMLSLIESMS